MDEIEPQASYYEYDLIVYSHRSNEIIAVELKGTTGNALIRLGTYQLKNTVKLFINRTLPSLAKQMKTGIQANMQVRACLITSGRFDSDALHYLRDVSQGNLQAKDISLHYDGKDLLMLTQRHSLDTLKSILERHFIGD